PPDMPSQALPPKEEGIVVRTRLVLIALASVVASAPACMSRTKATAEGSSNPTEPGGGSSGGAGGGPAGSAGSGGGASTGSGGAPGSAGPGNPTDGIKNGSETDVDCGGPDAPKCGEGKGCLGDGDCDVACNYAQKCVGAPSCTTHLGGDTCGIGEV